MLAFIFSGQGSQKRGMGEGLFDESPQYAEVEREVDRILGYSLRELCLKDVNNRLNKTQFTQPCLYVVNALLFYKAIREGARPDYLAGHSLGEYNALLAAGAFDFLTGLRLVQKRGELMSQAKNGGMAAVIGISNRLVPDVIKNNGLSNIDIANINSPLQTVVSGPIEDIMRAGPIFEKSGASLYIPLQVSAAFHSRYMSAAAKSFADFLALMSFSSPKIPVIANSTARPYPINRASESIKTLLAEQIMHSVRWDDSLRFLIAQGVTEFREIGPGNILTQMLKEIQHEKKY